jgi:hypothetical protein
MARYVEAITEIIPERHALPHAGLGQTEEGIAAIASEVAAGPGTDLSACDLTADVILRPVGMQGYFGPFQHHEHFVFVGMQSSQKAIQCNEASAAPEYAVEPGPQCGAAAPAGLEPIGFEGGVEAPDQPAYQCLGGAVLVGEGVQLMHQPFRMHPAQGVLADVELPRSVAQDDRILQETVRRPRAPLRWQPEWGRA